MRSRWLFLLVLLAAITLTVSPGYRAAAQAVKAEGGTGNQVAPAPWLEADPYFGASDFTTVVGEKATCTLCKSKICQQTGPCPGRPHPDPLNCSCSTCNGQFNCWRS